jgi:hypothetical protein
MQLLAEVATYPPLSVLVIRMGGLPWPILAKASLQQRGVTISDVLNSLYYNLRHTVSEAEFYGLRPEMQAAVTAAFKARYRRLSDDRDYDKEKGKGIKRVDFLTGRLRWAGLSSVKASPEEWVLNVN